MWTHASTGMYIMRWKVQHGAAAKIHMCSPNSTTTRRLAWKMPVFFQFRRRPAFWPGAYLSWNSREWPKKDHRLCLCLCCWWWWWLWWWWWGLFLPGPVSPKSTKDHLLVVRCVLKAGLSLTPLLKKLRFMCLRPASNGCRSSFPLPDTVAPCYAKRDFGMLWVVPD